MWLLKKLSDGKFIHSKSRTTKYLISENKSYSVGRKNCDFVFENDASISRKHCSVYIAKQNECPFSVGTVTGVWIVDEQSKYGTYLKNNNDWIKLKANENEKLTNGNVIKFGLMDNIWSLEYKPVVACASGIPTEQKKNIENQLQSIDGFLRNSWCKECSLVIVNEITLTVKVVLALINGVPIVTSSYIQKLVQSVKNQVEFPSYENYRPAIKETILDKSLVSLDVNNHRKNLFKGVKFVIPTKKQLETLKEVIVCAGGKVELLSSTNRLEKFVEKNVIVIQLPLNADGIPENLCKLFKEVSTYLKNHGRRVIPESEIAQAVAYSSTEKFCNPKSTSFNLRVGEKKQLDLGPVIVEETPMAADETKNSEAGVVPSSATINSDISINVGIESLPPLQTTLEAEPSCSNKEKYSERKRTHSPSPIEHEIQKKKAKSKVDDDYVDDQSSRDFSSVENKKQERSSKAEEKSIQNKPNQTKPSYITNYFQKQIKPNTEKTSQLIRQSSSGFWDFDTASSSKSVKRKISSETDDSNESSCSSRKKTKLPEAKVSKEKIDTPREIVEVLQTNKSSEDSASFPPIKRIVVEEEDVQAGFFGKDNLDNSSNSPVDELNNTIFSLTIISPAYIKEDGSLIDPPNVPVNVKRFRKQKIFSSVLLNSLEEEDDQLSEGEWIEPHSDRLNISVAAAENDW